MHEDLHKGCEVGQLDLLFLDRWMRSKTGVCVQQRTARVSEWFCILSCPCALVSAHLHAPCVNWGTYLGRVNAGPAGRTLRDGREEALFVVLRERVGLLLRL